MPSLSASKQLMNFVIAIGGICTTLVHNATAQAAPSFTLEQIITIATEQNPLIAISTAREEAANATVITAGTFSNPQLELGAGPTSYRTPGGQGNNGNWGAAISQPLDFPSVRNARIEAAERNVQVSSLGTELTKHDLRIRVKSAFYNVLQRESLLQIAEADLNLLQDIRERVKLRVNVGESPRYELIKADTEALAAQRDYQSAQVKVKEAKAYLRGLINTSIPEDYMLTGDLPQASNLPQIEQLRKKIDETPLLQQTRAVIQASEANLKLQEALRHPGVTVKAGVEQDPDLRQLRLGIAIPLPLWDQRRGQIAQAAAEVKETRAMLNERALSIRRDIESAYQRCVIAQQQVATFENGLLEQAESALKVAEAAYRYGERGILDYLDAQRTKRAVSKDYLAARYEYINTMLEIERLLGHELLEAKTI